MTHKLYSHVPLLDHFSDLSLLHRSSGGFYTLDRGEALQIQTRSSPVRAAAHAAGFRGLYDLRRSRQDGGFMIATGESGHIFSAHYGDLVPLWNDVKAITLAGSEEDLKRRGASELVLTP